MLLPHLPGNLNRHPLQGYPCQLHNGTSCLVVTAAEAMFSQPERLQRLYLSLVQRYPDSRILLVEEAKTGSQRYLGHPQAEKEIFSLQAQASALHRNPPQACFLPFKSA